MEETVACLREGLKILILQLQMIITPLLRRASGTQTRKPQREKGKQTDLDGRDVWQGGQVLRVGDGRDELDGRHGRAGGAAVGAGHGGRGGAGEVDGGVVHGNHREGPRVAGVGVLGRQRHQAESWGRAAQLALQHCPGERPQPKRGKTHTHSYHSTCQHWGQSNCCSSSLGKEKKYFMWLDIK